MGIAVGIDLVEVSRLARHAANPDSAFLGRAFTPAEREVCGADVRRLAGRWAAKEAAMKALGRGLGDVAMTDIEVRVEPSGSPQLHLSGRAATLAAEAGWVQWSLSISHDGQYATAVVAALTDR